jgi:CSLREA domain-containing protein
VGCLCSPHLLHLVLMLLLLTIASAPVLAQPHSSPAAALPAAQERTSKTFTVTTTEDTDEPCTRQRCSLRAAIQAANRHPGRDTIRFEIATGLQTIRPTTQLPTITDTVVLDGTSQPGFTDTPIIELDGSNIITSGTTYTPTGRQHTGLDGLTITGGESLVTGLVINRFPGNGLALLSDNNTIQGNFIGVDSAGMVAMRNGRNGILIEDARRNVIGGIDEEERNVIAGNASFGIAIYGIGTSDNRIQGNFIGTRSDGLRVMGNMSSGIYIRDAPETLIGGTQPGMGNLITGNRVHGIEISGSSARETRIQGNRIGTDAGGTLKLGNDNSGVFIDGASDTVIGGLKTGAANIIAANGSDGIAIFGDESTGNHIVGNMIGSDATGTLDIGNSGNGVAINSAFGNIVGGEDILAGNIIANNNLHGVSIQGSEKAGNQVLSNRMFNNQRSAVLILRSHAQIKNNHITDHSTAIQVQGTDVVLAGNTIAQNDMAIDMVFGNLEAYANNITAYTSAMRYLGGVFNGQHNWWGVASGTRPQGLEIETWSGRLIRPVAAWSEGEGSVTLDEAMLRGGSGTAVAVKLEHAIVPAPADAASERATPSLADVVCSDPYTFFTVNGSGIWSITLPVSTTARCAPVLQQQKVFEVPRESRCVDMTVPACWSSLESESIATRNQSLVLEGLTALQLERSALLTGNLDEWIRISATPTPKIVATATLSPTASEDATPALGAEEDATPAPDAEEPPDSSSDEDAEDAEDAVAATREPDAPRWIRQGWPNPWLPVEFRYIAIAVAVICSLSGVLSFALLWSGSLAPAPHARQRTEQPAAAPVATGPESGELPPERTDVPS